MGLMLSFTTVSFLRLLVSSSSLDLPSLLSLASPGFQGPSLFADFLPGADRLVLDQHPYLAFDSSVYTET